MKATAVILPLAALLLGGCAAGGGHCMGELDYQQATSLPPAAPVTGLAVEDSPSALKIPPPPTNPVPFGQTVPDPEDPGEEMVQCLDVPPALPPVAEPAAAPQPAKS